MQTPQELRREEEEEKKRKKQRRGLENTKIINVLKTAFAGAKRNKQITSKGGKLRLMSLIDKSFEEIITSEEIFKVSKVILEKSGWNCEYKADKKKRGGPMSGGIFEMDDSMCVLTPKRP